MFGEGSGTPLQYSCLENPMDGGAWWTAVHGIVKLDTTEQLHFHFSLSCLGEGNGNPLRCSCLENPRDRRAWQAAISGVAQSRTRLKRLGSSQLANSSQMPVFCKTLWCQTMAGARICKEGLRGAAFLIQCPAWDTNTKKGNLGSVYEISPYLFLKMFHHHSLS